MYQKIAVFISGPVRYVTLVNKRLEFVFSNVDYDCFYHLWKEDLANKSRPEKIRQDIVKDYIELKNHPRTKMLIIQEPYSEEDFADTIGIGTAGNSTINAHIGMLFSVNLLCHCIEQLPDFKNYKYILRLRTDCAIINDNFAALLDRRLSVITFSKSCFIPDNLISDHICFCTIKNFFKIWYYENIESIYKVYREAGRGLEALITHRYLECFDNSTEIRKSIVRFVDYHIVYYPTRSCEPSSITKVLNEKGVENFFSNSSVYVDKVELNKFVIKWYESWK